MPNNIFLSYSRTDIAISPIHSPLVLRNVNPDEGVCVYTRKRALKILPFNGGMLKRK